MTSLFELGERRGAEMPVDLIASGGRGVAMLEFFAIEEEEASEEEPVRAADTGASDHAKQVRAMVDAAREEAWIAARKEFEEELAGKIAQEKERVARVSAEFARDRQRYFAAAEAQVVHLAIAIARRVLAREVAGDVMHLTAVVRAALARVHDGSSTVLRVSADDAARWSEMFASDGEGDVSVVADDRLDAGECVLETEVGRVELGVEVQLEEIARGFESLLQRQGS